MCVMNVEEVSVHDDLLACTFMHLHHHLQKMSSLCVAAPGASGAGLRALRAPDAVLSAVWHGGQHPQHCSEPGLSACRSLRAV